MINAYHAIGITPFLVNWYIEKLQLQVDFDVTDNFNDELSAAPDVAYLQNSFQNLNSLLFMLHARDQFSYHVREYKKIRMSKGFDSSWDDSTKSVIIKALRWAVLLSLFENMKSSAADLADHVLCLAADVAVCEEIVDLVARVVAAVEKQIVFKAQERFKVWESRLRQTLDSNGHPFTVRFEEKRAEFKQTHQYDALTLLGNENALNSLLSTKHPHELCSEYTAFASQFLTIIYNKFQDRKTLASRKKKSQLSSDACRSSLLLLSNRNFYGRTQMSDFTDEAAHETKHSAFLEKCPEKLQKKLKRLTPYAKWLVNWSSKALAFSSNGVSSLPATIRVDVSSEKLMIGLCFAELRSFDWHRESKDKKVVSVAIDKLEEKENKDSILSESNTKSNINEISEENKENIISETTTKLSSKEVLEENKENVKSSCTEKDEITHVSSILTVSFSQNICFYVSF